ncbi:MAG: hypothetical protein IJ678_04605 [Kiritimatiellae bacterium]|nr:hypothetical protein [Kiritimatiellia bacterium]
MTISLESAAAGRVVDHGDKAAQLQSSWRVVASAAGERLVLEWEGRESAVLSLAARADTRLGATSLPASCGLAAESKNGLLLDTRDLQGEEGARARLHLEYRERNARETDADVKNGLHSRNIGAEWVERQELIEHFLARMPKGTSEAFDPTLFQAWLNEQDPQTRIAYAVSAGDGGDATELSGLTLAAAQRYAMGVQYAARQMLQVVVRETWRVPPEIDAKCNIVLKSGIPEEHRPEFKVKNLDGKFAWMRSRDAMRPTGTGFYDRTVAVCQMKRTP